MHQVVASFPYFSTVSKPVNAKPSRAIWNAGRTMSQPGCHWDHLFFRLINLWCWT
jgi:hypothetical protein